MVDFLSEMSPRYLRLTQSSVVRNLRTHFAVIRETFRGVLKVGSLLSTWAFLNIKRRLCEFTFSHRCEGWRLINYLYSQPPFLVALEFGRLVHTPPTARPPAIYTELNKSTKWGSRLHLWNSSQVTFDTALTDFSPGQFKTWRKWSLALSCFSVLCAIRIF